MNKVVIHVESTDDTEPGLTKSRASVKRFADDNVKTSQKSGKDSATGFAERFKAGIEQIGSAIAPNLTKQVGGAVSEAAEAANPLLVAGVVAATPLIAATLSAAISGGVALGAAGIGVLLVSKDPEVKAAGTALGKHFMTSLQQDASPFVAPVLAGIATIGKRFDGLQPTIANIFKNSSTFVQPLVDGATRGVAGILRGADTLVAKAGPVVDALGNSIGNLGQDFGNFLAGVDTKGAAAAINDLTDATGTLLAVTGPLISGLSQVYGVASKFGVVKSVAESLLGPIGMLAPLLGDTGKKAKDLGTSADAVTAAVTTGIPAIDTYGQSVLTAGGSLEDMATAADAATTAQLSLFGSFTDVGAAEDAATESAKKNGKTLDEHTEKGRANRTALTNLGKALESNYENYKDLNGIGPKTDTVLEKNRTAFYNAAYEMTHSKTAAEKLTTAIFGIPVKKSVKVDANTHDAAGRLSALQDKVNALHGKVVQLTIQQNYVTFGKPGSGGGLASGGVKGAASGGPQNGLTLVGEEGPELVSLPAGAMVQTAGASARAMAAGSDSGGGGWGGQPIIFQIDGKTVFKAILPHAQKTNRGLYANDAQRMWAG